MNTKKLVIGFVLGLVGYVAYRQLKRTQTVEVIGIQNSDLMFAGTRY